MNNQYLNNTKTVETESTAHAIASGLMAMLALMAMLTLMIVAAPVNAGKYDGTPWGVGFAGTMEYDPARCEICRAENYSSAMTECGTVADMKAGKPYVIYCGDKIWGGAGSAPGTRAIEPGGSIGHYKAGSDDWWTVK